MSVMAAEDVSQTPPEALDASSRNVSFTGSSILGATRHIAAQPRPIRSLEEPLIHPLATARYQSPLRYPGAKSGLADLIGRLLQSAKSSSRIREIDLLVEPFAGGASTSLRLVGSGIVNRILLADADPLVAAFWQVAAAHTENFIDRVLEEHRRYVLPGGEIALGRWDFWRGWKPKAGQSSKTVQFEMAVKCLFLNRTTFSGILHGHAGPIGGRRQTSGYEIGCRFNVDSLAHRIRYVGYLYRCQRLVDVWCKDWRDTIEDVSEWYTHLIPDRVIAYLDPPYIRKSQRLYQRSFDASKQRDPSAANDLHWSDDVLHYRLAEHLRQRMRFRWILSYDSHPSLLREPGLYAADRMTPAIDEKKLLGVKEWRISKRAVSLRYSASARRGRGVAEEVLITTLPPATVPSDDKFRTIA